MTPAKCVVCKTLCILRHCRPPNAAVPICDNCWVALKSGQLPEKDAEKVAKYRAEPSSPETPPKPTKAKSEDAAR